MEPEAELTDVTDLSAPCPAPYPQPLHRQLPPHAPTEGGEMAAMTASVLAGLGVKTPAPVEAPTEAADEMRAMTSWVLAGWRGAHRGRDAGGAEPGRHYRARRAAGEGTITWTCC